MKALLRLEDIGPGGYYETTESQMKLRAVADYLYMQHIPFHVAVIPRFIDPKRGYDCTMSNPFDAVSVRFVDMLQTLRTRGASLGMHGYTHQYGQSVSGEGYEFAYEGCQMDCPPDDAPSSLSGSVHMQRSYAYGRFHMALSAFQTAGLRPDWFETPHYAASPVQRKLLEACAWLIYENNPREPSRRQVTSCRTASLVGRTYYVPTPLGYVSGEQIDGDVNRIMSESSAYGEEDLASFFYHPFLEFPYIHIRKYAPPYYEERTPLKRIIQHMLSGGRRFVNIQDLIYSVISS
ncbi:DUF2334 domain-containing protein [Paenibacillus sp. GCM10023248]|uniref:DUF2334 domain-containing protein n=1 Tax=Bacillales TaxID=1385 RepID=UPI002378B06F|nr:MULTISPECIES: DUF2334 domain-containing protein [Bacillales]MDD9268039.1 DUF2334 domain-containing protein [Paenibacillus sp. MAHUQ-63]MDR6879712.1 putative deacetylase [Bacillus sp. 3255]